MSSEYKELFISESQEILRQISKDVIALEKNPKSKELIQSLFRGYHTIKGMSASMGYAQMSALAHEVESLLDQWRKNEIKKHDEAIEYMLSSIDVLSAVLKQIQKDHPIPENEIVEKIRDIKNKSPLTKIKIKSSHGAKQSSDVLKKMSIERMRSKAERSAGMLYEVRVSLDSSNEFMNARQMVILSTLSQLGEVFQKDTYVKVIKSGELGRQALFYMASKLDYTVIQKKISAISDVQHVSVTRLEPKDKKDDTNAPNPLMETHSIRVPLTQLDKLMNLAGELVLQKIKMADLSSRIQDKEMQDEVVELGRLTGELQSEVMQARLVPLEYLVSRYPRMVRDLAKQRQQAITLELRGTHIGLDRTILDEINDPLIHLLRNAVDHGIESKKERQDAHKTQDPKIKISAIRERNYVIIEVSDNGRGLSPSEIRTTAINKGIISAPESEKLTDEQALYLITHADYTTTHEVTDVSGRGVGMNIVKTKVENLGGTLSITSVKGQTATFKIKLPLSMAIVQALLVNIQGNTYTIPLSNVVETLKIRSQDLKSINNNAVMPYRGRVLTLVDLCERFAMKSHVMKSHAPKLPLHPRDARSIVVAESGARQVGLVVDGFLGQQEVVVKSLQSSLKGAPGLSGATILGNGKVSMILDVGAFV